MVSSALARWFGKVGLTLKLAVRSFTNIDTNPVPKQWTHITKVDPEIQKKLPLLFPLYLQHTSAISVGGSQDVDSKNTEETFELLRAVDVPTMHEPSAARHVTERTREHSRFLLIPEVLNGDSRSIVGTLGQGTVYLKYEMVPAIIEKKFRWIPQNWNAALADFLTAWLIESAIFEAYIIQNIDSAAAREANVTEDNLLTPKEAAERALAAEKHLESPVIYLEYSGTFGGEEAMEILTELREKISWSRIWYGGGIETRQNSTEVLEAGADTVIVGNIFHEIAVEERSMVQQAKEKFDSEVTASEIYDWIATEVDIDETSAYGYLATIPDVDTPVKLVRGYFAQSIGLHLLVSDLIESPEIARMDAQKLESTIANRLDSDFPTEPIPAAIIDSVRRHILSESGIRTDSDGDLRSHIVGLDT